MPRPAKTVSASCRVWSGKMLSTREVAISAAVRSVSPPASASLTSVSVMIPVVAPFSSTTSTTASLSPESRRATSSITASRSTVSNAGFIASETRSDCMRFAVG